jgi:hypothetical protein
VGIVRSTTAVASSAHTAIASATSSQDYNFEAAINLEVVISQEYNFEAAINLEVVILSAAKNPCILLEAPRAPMAHLLQSRCEPAYFQPERIRRRSWSFVEEQ